MTSCTGWLLDVSIENDNAILSIKTEEGEILKLRDSYYPVFYILPRNESLFQSLSREEEGEKFRYIDAIYDYKNIIEELQKLYMQTPVADRFIRDRIHSEMNEAQKDLAKTQAEYDSSRNTRQKLQ